MSTKSEFHAIGLFAKAGDPQAGSVLAEVSRQLREKDCELLADTNAARLLEGISPSKPTSMATEADLAIVVGGDGSLLSAARALEWAPVPLVGVNRGRIGFLADVRSESLAEELDAILAGHYNLERRSMLRVEVDSGVPEYAVNDVVIKGRDGARMIEVDTRVGDAWFSRIRGDGVIVATPTGSTAYALSAGGPIIAPGLDAFAIVPVSPHSLGERPAIVPADRVIHLHPIVGEAEIAEATLDGATTLELSNRETLRIRRAEHELLLIHPPGYEYFATLREKLGWGGRAP
jgi:NAD+ kinase